MGIRRRVYTPEVGGSSCLNFCVNVCNAVFTTNVTQCINDCLDCAGASAGSSESENVLFMTDPDLLDDDEIDG